MSQRTFANRLRRIATLAERRLERAVATTPLRQIIDPSRAIRLFEFLAVGTSGAVVDLATTTALLGTSHYLLANTVGFLLAVSWNFAGNWWLTYDRPKGSLPRQYASYVSLHGITFGVRAIAVAGLVEGAGLSALVATVAGIGVATIANFLGTERILLSGQLWFDAVEALNQVAHRVYGSRLRLALKRTGIYAVLYGSYQRVLARLYRSDSRTIEIAGATARLWTEAPPEIVSVLHTVEKEQAILEAFVDDVRPDDVVWDVGANLGVFATLAADRGADVIALEPHPPTARRCLENTELSAATDRVTVLPLALGATEGASVLAVEREEVGTQTPTVVDGIERSTLSADRLVRRLPGDRMVECGAPAPSVVKIDVEGAELDVLAGLSNTLAEDVRLVYVEAHAGSDSPEREAVRDRLEALGFDVDVVATAGSQIYYRGVE